MKVVEVVTVASIMKKEYPNIKHSWDVWQGTKNLGKKIVKGMWIGLLHHVIDVHEWILPFSSSNKCEHGPLSSNRDKGWLIKDSPPHKALRRIVMDKRLLNNIHYYLNCRSTAELENFQNLILMYASKRHSYRPPTYRCRNLLAALDHNMHSSRSVLTNKDGTIRYQRVFQKKSCRWSVTPCKAVKEYQYIPDLIKTILINRLQDDVGMNQGVVLEAEDPRRISAHLAPIPPPPTQQIVSEQRSRFISSARSVDIDQTIDYWTES